MKIIVCYHKKSDIFANEILTPLLCGASRKKKEDIESFASLCASVGATPRLDNEGENISQENRYFCELTGLYWAWKNLPDEDYLGLFHYRRMLDFTRNSQKSSDIKKLSNLADFGLDEASLRKCVAEFDIVLPVGHFDELYKHYGNFHYVRDLDVALSYIEEKFPQMHVSDYFTSRQVNSFANIFVAKRELFGEYCEWLFDILFYLKERLDYKNYNAYQSRIFGFFGELLLNAWIDHKKRENPNLKIGYFSMLNINMPPSKRFFGFTDDFKWRRFWFCGLRIYKGVSKWQKI